MERLLPVRNGIVFNLWVKIKLSFIKCQMDTQQTAILTHDAPVRAKNPLGVHDCYKTCKWGWIWGKVAMGLQNVWYRFLRWISDNYECSINVTQCINISHKIQCATIHLFSILSFTWILSIILITGCIDEKEFSEIISSMYEEQGVSCVSCRNCLLPASLSNCFFKF